MNLRYVLLSLLLLVTLASAQPKREFRAAWIATVANVDWPISAADAPMKQQTDLVTIYDSLARIGINAVIFQVRPSADAMYPSSIEPWSQWLTGTQGVAPSTPWDPLQYAIEQAHAYGFELHAWFNPYRTVVNTTSSSVSASHISVTHPEWNVTYNTLKMLNPGLPEVREYVTSVIMDVTRRYDIDGVHFDDYFYPYPQAGLTFDDSGAYAAYGGGLPLADWRRHNVNQLIKMVHDSLRAVKPRVKFGISPFGIWRNQGSHPAGSTTSGTESYSALYADTRYWLQQSWLDYMNPQIYWYIGRVGADYQVLVPWWDQNANGRHIYVGHGTWHAIDQNWGAKQIVDQINLNRTYPNVLGSVHFSAKWLVRSSISGIDIVARKLNDSLKGLVYQHRALRPTMNWIDAIPPMPPESLTIQKGSGYGIVRWKTPPAASDSDEVVEYLLYRSFSLPIDFNDMRNVVRLNSPLSTNFIEDTRPYYAWETAYFAVTALDRRHNESAPSNIMGLTTTGTVGIGLTADVPASVRLHQNFPNPFNPTTIIGFELAKEAYVTLRVYDLLGRDVTTLWDGPALAGYRQVTFEGGGLPSGIYFYRLTADGISLTGRMQLMK
jgi:uncharacterized lipoprotein YddW (UPF0748 family)